MEAMSRDFYLRRAKAATDPTLKKLLETLAAEEEKHYKLLHSLLVFISEEAEGYEVDALNFWVCDFECLWVLFCLAWCDLP